MRGAWELGGIGLACPRVPGIPPRPSKREREKKKKIHIAAGEERLKHLGKGPAPFRLSSASFHDPRPPP